MATRQELSQQVYKRFVDAIDLIAHKGFSINQATKQVGMSNKTFRAMNKERGNLISEQDTQQKVYKRFVDAVNLIKQGDTINKATKQAKISKNTFRAMNKERGNLVSDVYDTEKRTKTGKAKFLRHEVDDRFAYVQDMPAIVFDANGEPTTITGDFDKVYAGILGKYWHEVAKLIQGKNVNFSSLPDVIYDRDAKAYRLVKDSNTLYLFLQMQTDQYMSEIWKQFHSEKRKAA